MSEVIVERLTSHIIQVTINRPNVRNAVSGEVARQLEAAVLQTEADTDVRVVILTGAGDRAFCAGADLKVISEGRASELSTAASGFAGFVRAARSKPWIAAVNGAALAGGTEIVLACDMVVAADTAMFGLPEVKRGLAALAGGLYRLPKAIPRAIALELIATGAGLPAVRAYELGLVNYVVPAAQVGQEALFLAERIAENAPVAVRESLTIAREALEGTSEQLYARTIEMGQRLSTTADYAEGPRAFLEKRKPQWTGM